MIESIIIQTAIFSSATIFGFGLAAAKKKSPITLKDAKILWRLHKKTTLCTSNRWRPLSEKNGTITGFKCKCGYHYIQKRPLLSRGPAVIPNEIKTIKKSRYSIKLSTSQI